MNLETNDRVAGHLEAAERERLQHRPVGSTELPPQERLQMLFDKFEAIAAAVAIVVARPNQEEIRVGGSTPAGRYAEITLKRFYRQEAGAADKCYYGIDAQIAVGGYDTAFESINDKALLARDADRVSRDLSNLEETFEAAAMFVGAGFTAGRGLQKLAGTPAKA